MPITVYFCSTGSKINPTVGGVAPPNLFGAKQSLLLRSYFPEKNAVKINQDNDFKGFKVD